MSSNWWDKPTEAVKHWWSLERHFDDSSNDMKEEDTLSLEPIEVKPATPEKEYVPLGNPNPSLTDEDVAFKESKGNPAAQNPNTTASGLYQMTDDSRKDAENFDKSLIGSDYSDPKVQQKYRDTYIQVLSNQLKSKGVPVNTDNINRAWVIGAGGMSLLNKAKPEQMLIDVLPKSYFKKNKAGKYINPNLVGKSVEDFMNDPDPYNRKPNTTFESVTF